MIWADKIISSLSFSERGLSLIYTALLKAISKSGIGSLLISFLSILIWVGFQSGPIKCISEVLIYNGIECLPFRRLVSGPSTWLYYKTLWWVSLPLLVGFAGIDPDRANERIDKVIKYLRVSSESQKDKSGKDRQQGPIQAEIDELDVDEVLSISDDWESARTMSRENINKIINIITEDEESTYCLMVEDVDRLSRAEPLEADAFFWIAKEYDTLFYFDSMGYFDLSDPGQQLSVFFSLYQSRKEYLKISERTSIGRKKVKEDGGLPGPAPYGYQKEGDSNVLTVCEDEAEVIRDGVTILLNTDKSVAEAHRLLKEKYRNKESTVPSYSTLLKLLRQELYTGRITHEGETVGKCPQIISDDQYESLQRKLGERSREQHDDELDHVLESVIDRFGVETSLDLFEFIKGKCPKCGGDVKSWGSTERWGERVRRYQCKEEDCDFEGPLLSEKVLRKWEGRLPIICPLCGTPADETNWRQSKTKIQAIEQTCKRCGIDYTLDLPAELDDGLKRGLEFPELAIRWFSEKDQAEEDIVEPTSRDERAGDSGAQRSLQDFD